MSLTSCSVLNGRQMKLFSICFAVLFGFPVPSSSVFGTMGLVSVQKAFVCKNWMNFIILLFAVCYA